LWVDCSDTQIDKSREISREKAEKEREDEEDEEDEEGGGGGGGGPFLLLPASGSFLLTCVCVFSSFCSLFSSVFCSEEDKEERTEK
jgi:hypothetical protein